MHMGDQIPYIGSAIQPAASEDPYPVSTGSPPHSKTPISIFEQLFFENHETVYGSMKCLQLNLFH